MKVIINATKKISSFSGSAGFDIELFPAMGRLEVGDAPYRGEINFEVEGISLNLSWDGYTVLLNEFKFDKGVFSRVSQREPHHTAMCGITRVGLPPGSERWAWKGEFFGSDPENEDNGTLEYWLNIGWWGTIELEIHN